MNKIIELEKELTRQHNYLEQIRQCQDVHRQETGFARKYFIQTYGCQLNENDSEKLAGLLEDMGFIPAESNREADLLLLNTCSVRENADNKLYGHLGRIKNLRQDKPDMIIAVCGCMMKQVHNVDKISSSFSFVDLIFGPQDIYRLPELLYARIMENRQMYSVGDEDVLVEGLPVHRARKFRALVSIMFGCNNFCTYCIVPYTRGRERSRTAENIMSEIHQLAAEGYKEVMLLGQNVNSYGQDLAGQDSQQWNFAQLLENVAQIEGLRRIRFMTSHPKDISRQLLEVMAANSNIEPHLHLPLQSGSDRVLKKMNRRYTQRQYLDIVDSARNLISGLSISTDLIVGFPGETEADFRETLSVMRHVRFDSAFTFQYSPRQGTPAACLEPVPAQVVSERFTRLIELQNEHSLSSNNKLVGTTKEILIEGISSTANNILSGRTACNRLVNFSLPANYTLPLELQNTDGTIKGQAVEGLMANVRLTRAKTFSLAGELESLVL